MKIFYDTEFIDDGTTIELISIGMVAGNDDLLYLINGEVNLDKIIEHPFLRIHVLPFLPVSDSYWDPSHPEYGEQVWNRATIAGKVSRFIKDHTETNGDVELWAWYGAYDHVALAQLFGPMVNMPKHIPQWTNDLRQTVMRLEGITGKKIELPHQDVRTEHNALQDAYHLKERYKWLQEQYGFIS